MAATDTDVVTRILRGGEQAIEHYGLHRFTMNDVAKASGVRRQAIYEHVGSRDDLVRAILAEKAGRLHDRATAVIEGEANLSAKVIEGLMFIVADSLTEPYMQGLMGEGDFALVTGIVGADELMPKLTGAIWRPVLVAADRAGELVPDSNYEDIERWMTYITLMLVGARAQGLSTENSDRRLLTRMLLPALLA